MMQGLYNSVDAISTYKNALITSANNVANINTPYYKSNTLQLQDLKQGGIAISSVRQNQQQSYTIESGRTLDFVIDGPGNFKLNDNGQAYMTRKGTFYLDGEGDIVDRSGRVLLKDVIRRDEPVDNFNIYKDGTVTVNEEYRGKIDIYDSYGNKIPEDLYMLKSGMVEVSDVDYAREVQNMIANENAMAANYASVRTFDELLGLIVNVVG